MAKFEKLSLKSRIRNILCWLGGATPSGIAQASPDDMMAAARTGFTLLLVYCLEFCIFKGALEIAFQTTGTAGVIAAAALVAMIVVTVDHAIIHAHWFESGEALLRKLNVMQIPSIRNNMWPMYAIRISMTLVLSLAAAVFFDEMVYHGDIQAVVKQDNLKANATVVDRSRKHALEEIAAVDEELKQFTLHFSTDDEAKRINLQQTASVAETKRNLLVADIEAIRMNLVEQQAIGAQAQEDMDAEEYGVKKRNSQTGIEGKGKHYNLAKNTLQHVMDSIPVLRGALNEKEKQLAGVPVNVASIVAQSPSDGQRDRTIHDLTGRKLELQRDFAARVDALVAADLDHVPVADGLLVRGDALWRTIFANPLAVALAVLVMLGVLGLELSLLFSKIFVSQVGTYGARSAAQNLTDLQRLLTEHGEEWSRLEARTSALHSKRQAQQEEQARKLRESRLAEKAADIFDRHMDDGSWRN